jgi:hypothetical protein
MMPYIVIPFKCDAATLLSQCNVGTVSLCINNETLGTEITSGVKTDNKMILRTDI